MPLNLSAAAKFSALAGDIAATDGSPARTLLTVASDILASAESVRVNSASALALGQRVRGMVDVLGSLDLEPDAATGSETGGQDSIQRSDSVIAFRRLPAPAVVHPHGRILLDIEDTLRKLGQRSYLSQLLHQQRDKESLVGLSETVSHAFQILMMELRIQTSNMMASSASQALEMRMEALTAVRAAEPELRSHAGIGGAVLGIPAARLPPNPLLHFGRDSETDAVVDALLGPGGRVAILGGPGIGKTTLALAAVHRSPVVERFGSRRFFVPCDAADGKASCLTTIADAFGIASSVAKVIQRQLRDIIGTTPAVFILDNFESAWELPEKRQDAESVLQFLDSMDNASLVLTLRGSERPQHVRWTQPFLPPLAPLSAVAAKQTFLSIADVSNGCAGADAALDALLGRLGNIPLAVVLMANLAQVEPAERLLRLWDQLQTAMLVRGAARDSDRLSSLDVSINLSLRSPRMQAVPGAARLLAVLALLPCGVVDTDVALWNIPHSARALATLAQNALVLCTTTDQRIHVLAPIRSFMLAGHPPSESDAAPVFGHYFGLAQLAEEFAKSVADGQVLAVVAPELANIDSVIRYVLNHCKDGRRAALKAVSSLCSFYRQCGMGSGPELLPGAVKVAKELQFDDCRAELLQHWAMISGDLAIPGSPSALLREARDIYERLGDVDSMVDCTIRLITHLDPKEGATEGRRLFEALLPRGDSLRLARCAYSMGDCLRRDGKLHESIAQFETAIGVMHRAFGTGVQDNLVGRCKYFIGHNLMLLCDFTGAIRQLEEALLVWEATHYAQGVQAIRVKLADLFSLVGRLHDAVRSTDRVLAIDMPGGGNFKVQSGCLLISAAAHMLLGDEDASCAALEKVDRLAHSHQTTPSVQCNGLIVRSYLALARGDVTEARISLDVARTIARSNYLDPEIALDVHIHCVATLCEVEYAAGNQEEAVILSICSAVAFRAHGDKLNCARCLPRLAEAVDDDFAERLINAVSLPMQWMGLVHELAIMLLRSAIIARNRGQHELARRRARAALTRFGEIKGDRRVRLARDLAVE